MSGSDPAPPRQTERRIATLAIALSAAGVAQAFGRFTWGVILPDARDDLLGESNTLAGLFGSVNVGAYLLGTIVVAWMASRTTLVGLIRLGLVLSTTGLGIASVTRSPVVLAGALFIMGLGGAIIWVPVPGVASRVFSSARQGLATGIAGVGIGIGIIFSGWLAGILRPDADATAASGMLLRDGPDPVTAWQTVYRIEFMIAVVVLILAFTVLKPRGQRPSAAGGFGGFGALRQVQGWKPLTLAYAAYGFCYILVIAFLVARLTDDAGYSAERASLVFSVMGIAIIVGGLTIGSLSDRIGRSRTLVVAFTVWGVASLSFLVGSFPVVMVAAVAVGLMFSGIPATIVAQVVSFTDESTYGPAFSATTLAFGVAQMLSPQIGGALADLTGSFTVVFVLAAAVAGLGALAGSRLPG